MQTRLNQGCLLRVGRFSNIFWSRDSPITAFLNFEGPVPHIFLFSAVFGQKGVFFQANKIRQSILTVFPVVWNTFGV